MSNDPTYLSRLQDFYAKHRILPSYSTIGELLGLRSKSSVAALVARLKLQGYIEIAPGKRLRPATKFFGRTLVSSTVRAGLPNAVSDSISDTLTIDEYLIKNPSKTVLIPVKGDSMIDAGINSGDIVIVEKKVAAHVGDIVIAIVDNEFTLKYLAKEKDQFILQPANNAYPTIRPKGNLEIFGVVIGLVRKYEH